MGGFFLLMFIDVGIWAFIYTVIGVAGLVAGTNFGLLAFTPFAVLLGVTIEYTPTMIEHMETLVRRAVDDWRYAADKKRWLTCVLVSFGCVVVGSVILMLGLPYMLGNPATGAATWCAVVSFVLLLTAALLIKDRRNDKFFHRT
jgi:hypothetical protein